MAHDYSVKIQNYISEKISIAMKMKINAERQDDFAAQKFCEGQLKELHTLRQYLTEKIDLKTQRYY